MVNICNVWCCSYAGAGRDCGVTAALQVEGVPPTINSCIISYSAYNGINVTDPQAPVTLVNTTLSNNRGKEFLRIEVNEKKYLPYIISTSDRMSSLLYTRI